MKKKKLLSTILSFAIIICNFQGIGSSYAATTSSKKELKSNKTYYYDLDGNGKKEKIKQVTYRDEELICVTKLYINNKLKKKYENIRDINVYLCDFNKKDGKKEIYIVQASCMSNYYPISNIFRYNKNGTFKNYKLSGYMDSYNNNTGIIKFRYAQSDENSNFKSFTKALGGTQIINYTYKKVSKSSFSNVSQKSATIMGDSAFGENKALKTLTAYTSTSGKKVAYKINKNDYVYFVSLYKSGSKKYVKVKSYKGKYGWIKVSSTRIFDLY